MDTHKLNEVSQKGKALFEKGKGKFLTGINKLKGEGKDKDIKREEIDKK